MAACHRGDPDGGRTVEVAHSWTSGGEARAVGSLAQSFDAAGGHWKNFSVAGFQNTYALVLNRFAGGVPPGAAQFIAGPEARDLATHGMLLDLDQLALRDRWRARLSPDLMDAISADGHVYEVPLNIHVNNWLYVSRKALNAVGMKQAPADWPGFFAMLDRFRSAGIVPLAQGGQVWQEQILFDTVLLSKGGRDLYLRIYRDRDANAVRSPAFREVARTFARLRRYADPGSPGRNWNDATAMVIDGRAGVQIIGDWAASELRRSGLNAPDDYLCVMGPQDAGAIVSSDVFVFPKSRRVDAGQQRLLADVVTRPAAQTAFSGYLGSLPAFAPSPAGEGLSWCDQAAWRAATTPGRSVPYVTSLLPPDVLGDLNDVVGNFWSGNELDPDKFVERFASALETAT